MTHITEVQRMEGEVVILSDIFTFKEEGSGSADGKVIGRHKASGNRPGCIEELARHGITFPPNFFFSPNVQENNTRK